MDEPHQALKLSVIPGQHMSHRRIVAMDMDIRAHGGSYTAKMKGEPIGRKGNKGAFTFL